jgi:hypothetical protein
MQEERAELDAVFASGIFDRAPGLAQLLNYVCGKYFDGQSEQIKEYNIAVEAMGRPADFDQKRDSIVRVEAHRLRKRLSEFYEAEGATHPLQIVLPAGRYIPQFVRVSPRQLVHAEPQLILQTEALPVAPAIAEPAVVEFDRRSRASRIVMLTLGITAVVVLIGVLNLRTGQTQAKEFVPPAPVAPGSEIRIIAGSTGAPYTDQFGQTWLPDRYFTGGYVNTYAGHAVDGTHDAQIFQTTREGDFQYDIPLNPGVYELRLHFAELLYGERNAAGGGETSRIFHADANGKRILTDFDVIADAAGASLADERVFRDISPAADGQLHLRFTHMVRDAFLNAIEITPGTPGHLRPIRIVMSDHGHYDRHGNRWDADHYYRGGQLVQRPQTVSGADDPDLYRGERYGNLTYVIPVTPGSYVVTLRFAESWFGPGRPVGGGVGSRRFDIMCNSAALARNFDIFREAGGAQRAVEKTFHGLQPNAQGKLVISLLPIENYAAINAIEVVEESK